MSPDIGKTIMDLMGLPLPTSLSDVKKKAEKKLCQKVVIYRTMPIPIREKWNLVPVLCWPLGLWLDGCGGRCLACFSGIAFCKI